MQKKMPVREGNWPQGHIFLLLIFVLADDGSKSDASNSPSPVILQEQQRNWIIYLMTISQQMAANYNICQ